MKKILSCVMVLGELILLSDDAGAMNGNSMVDKSTQAGETRQVPKTSTQSTNRTGKAKINLSIEYINYTSNEDLVSLQKVMLSKISGQYGLDYNFCFDSFPDIIYTPSMFCLGPCCNAEVKIKTPLERVYCAIMKSKLVISWLATGHLQQLGMSYEIAKIFGGALLLKTISTLDDFFLFLKLQKSIYEERLLNNAYNILKVMFSNCFINSTHTLMEFLDALRTVNENSILDSEKNTTIVPQSNSDMEQDLSAILENYSHELNDIDTTFPFTAFVNFEDIPTRRISLLQNNTKAGRRMSSALGIKLVEVLGKRDSKLFLNELSNAYVVHWDDVEQNTVDPTAKIRLRALLDMADSESLKLTGLGVSEWTANVMSSVYVLAHLDSINDLLMLLKLCPQGIYDEMLINRASEKLHYIFSDSFITSLEGLVSLRQILNELKGENFESPKDILRTIDKRLPNFDTEEETGTMPENTNQ